MLSTWFGRHVALMARVCIVTFGMMLWPGTSAQASAPSQHEKEAVVVLSPAQVDAVQRIQAHGFSPEERQALSELEKAHKTLENYEGGLALYISIGGVVLVAAIVILVILLMR